MNYIYYFDSGTELAKDSLKKMSPYLESRKDEYITIFNDICVHKYNIVSIIAFTGNLVLQKNIQLSEPMTDEYYLKAIRAMSLGFQYGAAPFNRIIYSEIFREDKQQYTLPRYCSHIRRIHPYEKVQDYSYVKDGFIWFDETGLLGVDYTFFTYEEALKSLDKYVEKCL